MVVRNNEEFLEEKDFCKDTILQATKFQGFYFVFFLTNQRSINSNFLTTSAPEASVSVRRCLPFVDCISIE